MQDARRQSPSGEASGRSSVERLPPSVREAVDAAIADGASVDALTALIREKGGECSRSAVGRYAKRTRDLIRRRYEAGRIADALGREAEERGEGHTGLVVVEALRSLVLLSVADLSAGERPITTEELVRISLVLRRLEGSDKLRIEGARATAKAAAGGSGSAPKPGLSHETVAAIREAVEGKGWR